MGAVEATWILRLSEAIADDDPESAWFRALACLSELGLSPEGDAGAQPWLELDDGSRWYGQPTGVDLAQRPLLSALLTGLRLRLRDVERLRMLSAASFEGLFIHIDGEIIDANDQFVRMSGYEREEVLGKGLLFKVAAKEDLERVLTLMSQGYEGCYTITAVRKDGSRFRAELQAKQGLLGDHPVRVAAVRDVTERERQTELLRESEAGLRALAVTGFDYFVMTVDGRITEVGGEYERTLGYTREELLGKLPVDLASPDTREEVANVVRAREALRFEAQAVAKSGEVIPVEVVSVNASYEGKPARLAGIRDLREVRRLEAERRDMALRTERAQRMEALGILAGGIAHDFNNLLMGILGHTELLSMRLKDAEDKASTEAILGGVERAVSLTRQMLAYAGKRRHTAHEPLDLSPLLNALERVLSSTLSQQATITIEVPPGCVVVGDRTTLNQVFMNLLTNASDALQGKPGEISVRARHLSEPPACWADALGVPVRPGDWVQLDVCDSGIGMDSETHARIFEPFFSTKSKGHGLGLAACAGIIQAHQGAIRVESAPGQGSCFSLLLPATSAQLQGDARGSAIAIEPCRVLLIDDEDLVRGQLARHLQREGFTTREAKCGTEGVAMAAEVDPELIIVDLSMPDINGIEVARRVRAQGCKVPIILASGYLTLEVESSLPPGLIQALLHKPFSRTELLGAVATCRAAAS